jgi:uncharacterized protein (DUF2141 family)
VTSCRPLALTTAFRIRLALSLLLAAVLLVAAETARANTAPSAAVLSARLVALRNDNGKVGCGLYASEKGFPKDPSAAIQMKWCAIANRGSLCSFDPIPAGTYAVACFHDENNNDRLDTGVFGIPAEGVVSSNHAKGFMGPPTFKDAKFRFSGAATELRLKMGY